MRRMRKYFVFMTLAAALLAWGCEREETRTREQQQEERQEQQERQQQQEPGQTQSGQPQQETER